jgi:glycosyltransferase involved in cell wall biosynthesis
MRPSAKQPLVSIVVPSFNGEEFVMDALESCLAQTYKNIEVVCVNDCSSDFTVWHAEAIGGTEKRLHFIQREVNGGISRAFNTEFKAATGRHLARLACDDIFFPHAIEVIVGALVRVKDVDLVYCDMDQIDENDQLLYSITNPPATALLPRNRLELCVMWTRALMDSVGWLDPSAELAEDYDFWLRASMDFRFLKVEVPPQLGFRIHGKQASIAKGRKFDAAAIRVQVYYLWRCVKRSPFRFTRGSSCCDLTGASRFSLANMTGYILGDREARREI